MANDTSAMSEFRKVVIVLILCLSHLLTQAALGQVIAPLPVLARELGAKSVAESSWFIASYSLTVGTFVLIAGRIGDLYGHRLMILIGFTWFGVWSLISGFSVYSGKILFNISRSFQGIGPAILLPNCLAVLARTFPPGWKKKISFCLFGAAGPNGFILGALFSSLFSEFAWWPWAFWVLGIFCFMIAVFSAVLIPSQPPSEHTDGRTSKLDLPGVATGVISLILINFAWNQGAAVGWTTPYTYALLIVGIVFLLVFGWLETKSLSPVLPWTVLNIDTAFVLTCIACGWSSFGIWLFYAWQISERVLGYEPLSVVAQFSPVAISGLVAAFVAAYLLGRVQTYYIMILSMASFLLGSVLFATAPMQQICWAQAFVSIIVMPWGMDMSYPSGSILISEATSLSNQGIAASLMNTAVNYFISLGLGIAGTVESNIIGPDSQDELRGFRAAQYVGVGFAGAGFVVSIIYALMRVKASREYVDDSSIFPYTSSTDMTEV